jgi:hypothetical protein
MATAEGLPEDHGRVRFSAFMTQLQNFSATLNKIDRDTHDGKTATYFEIAELSYSSPVRVVLEPRGVRGRTQAASMLVDNLDRIADAIQGGDSLSGLDADLLDDLRGLAKPVGKTVRYAALMFRERVFELTESVSNRLDVALAVEDECDGDSMECSNK